jgi:hypothetical protein
MLGSNFDLEILVGRKISEVVENADESGFGEGQLARAQVVIFSGAIRLLPVNSLVKCQVV